LETSPANHLYCLKIYWCQQQCHRYELHGTCTSIGIYFLWLVRGRCHVVKDSSLFLQDDTLNLYTYAVLRLTPRALSFNASSWSYLRKGTSISAGPTASSSNGTTAGERYHSRSRDTSPVGQNQMHHNFRPKRLGCCCCCIISGLCCVRNCQRERMVFSFLISQLQKCVLLYP
jgi:hypothetical protein